LRIKSKGKFMFRFEVTPPHLAPEFAALVNRVLLKR
jgi:hypothetical protein